MPPSIVAIADDLTGALEAGAKFAAHGLPGIVISDVTAPVEAKCPLLVIDTETRHVPADEARARVREVVEWVRGFSPQILYKKTDSTLRGNIGAEFRAIQDVFHEGPLVYAPAYPKMGRAVKNGELWVWGRRVHETEFANDALNPVCDCKVQSVLGDVAAVVLDGECDEDIDRAAKMILEKPVPRLCAGPAALAEALALHLSQPRDRECSKLHVERCLVVNGSLHPSSLRQMEVAGEQGVFDGNWKRLDEAIEGAGRQRARRAGECVRRLLDTQPFDALVVFGGDTAFGIHSALGTAPFEPLCEIVPGVPAARCRGLLWVTKAGGFGPPHLLSMLRERLT